MPATGPVHGRHREDGTELHVHESGRGASRIRVLHPATPRTFDIMPDGRIVGVGTSGPKPKRIRAGADSRRAELVRGAEAPRADEVTEAAVTPQRVDIPDHS